MTYTDKIKVRTAAAHRASATARELDDFVTVTDVLQWQEAECGHESIESVSGDEYADDWYCADCGAVVSRPGA